LTQDFSTLKRRATARPDGPEALRLAWLHARVIGSPRQRLDELIKRYRAKHFSIPEIDAYIAEEAGEDLPPKPAKRTA
jgi:hypothetical protein